MGRAKRREVVDRVPTLQVPLHSSRLRAVVISVWTVRTTARIPCVCSRHLSWMGYGGSWCHKVEMETQSRSGWCSGYHARFTRERSRVQSSHPIFFYMGAFFFCTRIVPLSEEPSINIVQLLFVNTAHPVFIQQTLLLLIQQTHSLIIQQTHSLTIQQTHSKLQYTSTY